MKKNETGSRSGKFLSRIFNVRGWADLERGKATGTYILELFKRLFLLRPKKASNSSESFTAAVKRYNLSNEEIEIKKNALWRLALLMFCLGILLLFYSVYQIFYGHLLAILLSIVVTLIAFILAFRYHFWFFQIKQRRLGCTVRDWWRQGVLGGKQ